MAWLFALSLTILMLGDAVVVHAYSNTVAAASSATTVTTDDDDHKDHLKHITHHFLTPVLVESFAIQDLPAFSKTLFAVLALLVFPPPSLLSVKSRASPL